jgi:hypothetical protein
MTLVASVAARKVSAKSFFMDCSFHCSTIRRNFSEPHHFIFGPSPSSHAAMFFIDTNTEMGIPCGIAGIADNYRKFQDLVDPCYPVFSECWDLFADYGDSARSRAIPVMIWPIIYLP